jgi:hypothetical protein
MLSANRFVASDWMEGSVVISVAGERRSVIEGIITRVIARHRRTLTGAKWGGGRKEGIRLINYNLERNKTRGVKS